MRTLQQAIDDCCDLCRQKWGDDWNKTVYLNISLDVSFHRSSKTKIEPKFRCYVDAAGFESVYSKTTDGLVVLFRERLGIVSPEPAEQFAAAESIVESCHA